MTLRDLTLVLICFPKPLGVNRMNRGEHEVLSRRVEVSGVLYLGPLDSTTWQERGTVRVVLFLDDLQSVGGSSGCVV